MMAVNTSGKAALSPTTQRSLSWEGKSVTVLYDSISALLFT